jgi:integrase
VSNSTKRPPKPYPEFPLYAHPAGYWAKKVLGRLHYFGRWGRVVGGKVTCLDGETWREALGTYKLQIDDLRAGRTPRVTGDGLTVGDLCNRFLTSKTRKIEAGELSPRMFEEYKLVTDMVVSAFGVNRLVDDLTADDFAQLRVRMAKRWGPYRLKVGVVRVKSVFKYGTANALIEKAVRYGSEFVVPSGTTLRRHRMKAGEKMIEAADLWTLIDAADPQMRALILLGLNCGFGNADLAMLGFTHLDLDRGWVNLPRAKTGVPRRCPLWPETVTAIRTAIEERPKPAGYAECGVVFLTERGTALVRPASGTSRSDILAVRFRYLLRRAGLGRHVGLGFYTLRRVHRTVADGARDQVAANSIMGHVDTSMAAMYRQRIDDERLKAVTDHVRAWLLAGRGARS